MEEFEVKFLGINPDEMAAKLVKLGADKVFDRVFHRVVFDYPDLRLDKAAAWIRVRDEGDKVTMSYKQRLEADLSNVHSNDAGMIEEEIVVSDFETTCKILRHIGLIDKFFIENRRVQYKLDGVEVDIEYWPLIEPYIEIEGGSWEDVDRTVTSLGLNPDNKKIFSTTQIYEQQGIRDKDYQILTFEKQVKKS